MLQGYLLYFDTEIMKIQAEILQLHDETTEVLDQELKQVLQAEGYDFFDYSEEIAILVDDQGFEKPLNPVFEIVSAFGDRSLLAGRLIFVRNVENEYSTDIGSIKYEDVFNLRIKLEINLIGLTNQL
ncbi:hypothetical protein [Lysinibacillus sp. SGAir0095]|uniref:hypothetical protein n=1 Tax=Lysinibacillus sp. SGAir0095 TaxID=2070463 RepID=UPI0010CCF6F0|nr:hypothetical protein [Lysinibacillus sp. SGAir0095]QCR33565.1 hypothetical protein C1N55_16015 [Lysinibacillus sp. SGAir0095]